MSRNPTMLISFNDLWNLIDYWQSGKTARELASIFNVSDQTIDRRLKALGLKTTKVDEIQARRNRDKTETWRKAWNW